MAGFQVLALVGDRSLDYSLEQPSTAEKHTIINCPPASNVYEEYDHIKVRAAAEGETNADPVVQNNTFHTHNEGDSTTLFKTVYFIFLSDKHIDFWTTVEDGNLSQTYLFENTNIKLYFPHL
ncbi:unnamed protein product [Eretmochelys imbricata]